MALTRSISRLDLAPIPQTVGDAIDRGPLLALSQRKLNALGTPIAYIDRNQRYRFVNKALLDWFGKRSDITKCIPPPRPQRASKDMPS